MKFQGDMRICYIVIDDYIIDIKVAKKLIKVEDLLSSILLLILIGLTLYLIRVIAG